MDIREIAGTTIKVSAISLGTGSLHHIASTKRKLELLQTAHDFGITHFDTSPYYGLGLGETALGKFLRNNNPEITVTSKFGLYPFVTLPPTDLSVRIQKLAGKCIPNLSKPRRRTDPKVCHRELSRSLKRLRRDYIDFLLFHEPVYQKASIDSLHDWLLSEQKAGRIRAFGLAGTASSIAPFLVSSNPLSVVIQTKDSLTNREADFLVPANRPFQFTYGYLNSSSRNDRRLELDVATTLRLAIQRNQTGSVIVSTRKAEHLNAVRMATS